MKQIGDLLRRGSFVGHQWPPSLGSNRLAEFDADLTQSRKPAIAGVSLERTVNMGRNDRGGCFEEQMANAGKERLEPAIR
jgi:hypothetical protein